MNLVIFAEKPVEALVSEHQRWSRSRSAGVDSGRSLRFLPKPEQDPESDFWMKTGPGAGTGVIFQFLQESD